jgi:methionyl-tRNA formyltransferase
MSPLRLAFMGTPDFAAAALAALLEAGHNVVRVYCRPPRPAGRGQRARPSPVQRLAEARGLALGMPAGLKDAAEARSFEALALDAAVVAAYGLILPKSFLALPRLGCLNIHASLLPRWRGAAPIARAILAGDAETGITIMKMEEGLDTGPILLQERLPIGRRVDAGALHDALAALGARLILEALEGLAQGRLAPRPQPADGVSYAAKIDKAETRLDWSRPAIELDRQVRAFSPQPGAWFELTGPGARGERVRLLAAEPKAGLAAPAPPGSLLDDGLTVRCGDGALRLLRLQRAGGKPMDAAEFLRGRPLSAGASLA